jgi:hypothetical protein
MNHAKLRLLGLALCIALGTISAPSHAATPCEPILGLDGDDVAKARFLVFGEQHGTNEVPAFVGQVVCLLSAKRPIVVALELNDAEQAHTDAFLASSGTAADAERFLQSGTWGGKAQWGVTSVAMFRLIDQIRTLRKSGRDVALVHFKPSTFGNLHQDYYEIRMASSLVQATDRNAKALVVALMGNIHARKTPLGSGANAIVPAVSHLPARDVLTFNAANMGGSAWQCREDGCRVFSFPGKPKPKGLYRSKDLSPFDGEFAVGTPFTASPPAATSQK